MPSSARTVSYKRSDADRSVTRIVTWSNMAPNTLTVIPRTER
jgi:hypothetical protein